MCLIRDPPQSADCHPWTLDFGIHAEMTGISISAGLVYDDERSGVGMQLEPLQQCVDAERPGCCKAKVRTIIKSGVRAYPRTVFFLT
jgi:hypothetical protein